jgi:uncharacterized protein (DUF2132 family)
MVHGLNQEYLFLHLDDRYGQCGQDIRSKPQLICFIRYPSPIVSLFLRGLEMLLQAIEMYKTFRNRVMFTESHDFVSPWTQSLFRNYCAVLQLYPNVRLHMRFWYHPLLKPTRTIGRVSNPCSGSYCHTNVHLVLRHARIRGSTTPFSLYYFQHIVWPVKYSTIETTWQKTHTAQRGNGTV